MTTKTQEPQTNALHFFKIYYGYILIPLVGFGLYAQTMAYGYVGFDDTFFIIDKAAYVEYFSNIYKGFTHSILFGYYRPLLSALVIMEYTLGKTAPFIYHLSNILIHLLSCLLLFRLLCLLEYDRWISFWTTLFFTVHPLFTQAVAWIFGRNDSLLAIFILSSVIAYIQYQKTSKKTYLFLHLFWYTACLLTKETGVILALVCFTYSVFKVQKEHSIHLKKIVFFWVMITLAWLLIRHNVMKETSIPPIENAIHAFFFHISFIFESIAKLILLINQSVYASYSLFTSLIGGGVYLLLLGLVLYIKPRFSIVLWTTVWWFLFLVPPMVLPVTSIDLSDYLEHRVYVPALGFIIFLNEAIHTTKKNFAVKTRSETPLLSKWIFLPIVCILSSITYIYSKNFENVKTFWKSATETSPHNSSAWRVRGIWTFDSGDLETAEIYQTEALRLNTAKKNTWKN
ncbi:MAG: hypothetical protein QM536_06525 [Chitinophagaceae bacterium]|nr:hypothetical protein [Chitinophagaceae bacterium]